MPKVLIIDTVNDILTDKLIKAGFEISYGIGYNRDKLIQEICNYDGIILRSRITIDKEIVDNAQNLRFVARVGSGMESIDTAYCKAKNIVCLNSPEGNRNAVAEHCLGMLLCLNNKLLIADAEVKSGKWNREKNRGIEIEAKTIGIIGYGNTGSAFAEKLKGFNCNIIAYDKYKSGFGNEFVKEVSMQEIFAESDVLSLHVPLTDETNYLVHEAYISNFNKNITLLNTARGPVVNTSDLINALKTGKILAAGLDVIEYEETSFEKTKNLNSLPEFRFLAKCENVMLSPHIAGWTHESHVKLSLVLAEKIIELYR